MLNRKTLTLAMAATFGLVAVSTAQFPGVQGSVERQIQLLEQKKQYAAGQISKADDVASYRTKIEEGTTGQILEFYNDYAINGTLFSFPWVIDYDQKLSSSLSAQNLDCQITSSAANTLTATIVQEVPGYR